MSKQDVLRLTRNDFPSLKRIKNDKPPIYFDNACTSLVPQPVIDALNQYYTEYPACGGWRSRHWFSQEVTMRVEGEAEQGITGARQIVREFINARSAKEIIFTQNTSHAINLVALGFKFRPGDVVLLTDKEHNSNLIPWLRLQKQGLIKVDFMEADENGKVDFERLKKQMEYNPVKLVSLVFTSNLTGETLPAGEIIKMAHKYGACVLLDGAQTVPHHPVDVQALDVDFLAFSAHKMCGPKGVGVLYARKEMTQPTDKSDALVEPVILGGGTVSDTTYTSYGLLDTPERFEAGVQNYPGQIGAGVALKYLQTIGMDKIAAHETVLNKYLTHELMARYGDSGWFSILGPPDPVERGGILTFEVRRPNSVGISDELNERNNIMLRDGAFCVHSFLNRKYGRGWTEPNLPSAHKMVYRISLYFYNTREECRLFIDTLDDIFKERAYV